MKVGITYNLKEEISSLANLDSEQVEEFDTALTVDAIYGVLEKNGFEPIKLGGNIDVLNKLKNERVDFVFNIAEGYHGRNRESHIPNILEMLRIPYSGSDPLTLGMTLDKITTKKIASQAGISVPSYRVIEKVEDISLAENHFLCYPLIAKPAWEGSSKGIYNSSKVLNKEQLKKSVIILLERYPGQPVLIEEYIEGREITSGIIGNGQPDVLGLMEIVCKNKEGGDFFYSLEVKRDWKNLVDYVSPPDISEKLDRSIKDLAIKAFKEFGCRDVARIDFRISKSDEVFLLELNPLPGLSPEYADLVIIARKQGLAYEPLILKILSQAMSRYGLSQNRGRCLV